MEKEPHDIRLKINPEIYPELYEMLNKVKRKSRGDLLIRLAHDRLMGNQSVQYNPTNVDNNVVKSKIDQTAKTDEDPEEPINPNETSSNLDAVDFNEWLT